MINMVTLCLLLAETVMRPYFWLVIKSTWVDLLKAWLILVGLAVFLEVRWCAWTIVI
jgi:hypothetical protein